MLQRVGVLKLLHVSPAGKEAAFRAPVVLVGCGDAGGADVRRVEVKRRRGLDESDVVLKTTGRVVVVVAETQRFRTN